MENVDQMVDRDPFLVSWKRCCAVYWCCSVVSKTTLVYPKLSARFNHLIIMRMKM